MTDLRRLEELPRVTYITLIAGEVVGQRVGAIEALRTFPKDEPRAKLVAEILHMDRTTYREVMPSPRPLVSWRVAA